MPTIIFKHPSHKTGTDQRVHRPKSAQRAAYAWVGAANRPYWAPGSTKKKPGRKGAADASPAPAPAMRSSGTGPTRGSGAKPAAKPYVNPTTGGTRSTADMLAGAKFKKPDGRKVKPNMLTVPAGGWNAKPAAPADPGGSRYVKGGVSMYVPPKPAASKPASEGSRYVKGGVSMYVPPKPAAPARAESRYVKGGVPMTAYPRPAAPARAESRYVKGGVPMTAYPRPTAGGNIGAMNAIQGQRIGSPERTTAPTPSVARRLAQFDARGRRPIRSR